MLAIVVRYSQPVFMAGLGTTFFFWTPIAPYLGWDINRLVGTTLALFAGVLFYYDRILHRISEKPKLWEHANLAASMRIAFDRVKEPQVVRIFALSTFMIQPIMLAYRIRSRQCQILVYDARSTTLESAATPKTEKGFHLVSINEWEQMRSAGLMSHLEIRASDLYPTEFFILIDDRALVSGHYLFQDERFPNCEVQEPFVISDETADGKIAIRKYLEVFDRFWQSKRVRTLHAK